MKYVFASHTFIGGTYVVGSHHYSKQLSNIGHEVIHISSPITLAHLIKFRDPNSRYRLFRGFFNRTKYLNNKLVDIIPFSLFPWIFSTKYYVNKNENLQIRTMYPKSSIKNVDYLLVDEPTFVGIEEIIKPNILIYRATDINKDMRLDKSIAKAEEEIIKKSNGLIATSKPVLDYLTSINSSVPSLLLENGVEYDHFAKPYEKPNEYLDLKGKIMVYVGAMDFRFDFEAIVRIAKQYKKMNIILIGPTSHEKVNMLRQFNNVYILGARKYSQIPSYLQHADLALLPLNNHKSNKGRSPMKLYEYAASGLPVISKRTDEIDRRKDDFTFLYEDHDELVNLIDRMLLEIVDKDKIRESAKRESWEYKTKELENFLYYVQQNQENNHE